MASTPDTQTTTTTTEPPKYVQPYAEDYLKRAQALSTKDILPALPSGAERIQGFSPDQIAAFNMVRDQALNGNPTVNAAEAGLSQFYSPDSAFSPLTNQLVNQSNQNIVDAYNNQVVPSLNSAARASGSYGNTGLGELDAIQRYGLSRSLGENEANIRNQALNRSLSAIGMAPAFAGLRTNDINALNSVGAQQQGLSQAINDINFQNLLSARDQPFTQLNVLGSALNTASGGYGTTTSIGPGQSGGGLLGGLGAFGSLLGGAGLLAGALFPPAAASGLGGSLSPSGVIQSAWPMY